MNSKNLLTRKTIQQVGSFSTLQGLLDSSTLSDLDKEIVVMHYIQEKNFAYIGDELGYSESGIKKRHKKILNKISQLL